MSLFSASAAPSSVKDIYGMLKGGTAFSNPLSAKGGSIAAQVAALKAQVPAAVPAEPPPEGEPEPPPPVYTEEDRQAILAALDSAAAGSGGLVSHGNSQIGGLKTNMGVVNGKLSVDQSLTPGASPCFSIGDFFGSLLGEGDLLLTQVMGLLGDIGDAIGALVDAVASGIGEAITAALGAVNAVAGAIADAVGEIASMIAGEIAALGDAIADLLDFGFAGSLGGLMNNPCMKALVEAVGTPDLLGAARKVGVSDMLGAASGLGGDKAMKAAQMLDLESGLGDAQNLMGRTSSLKSDIAKLRRAKVASGAPAGEIAALDSAAASAGQIGTALKAMTSAMGNVPAIESVKDAITTATDAGSVDGMLARLMHLGADATNLFNRLDVNVAAVETEDPAVDGLFVDMKANAGATETSTLAVATAAVTDIGANVVARAEAVMARLPAVA